MRARAYVGHQGFGSVVRVVLSHLGTCNRLLIELELSFHPHEANLSGNALL